MFLAGFVRFTFIVKKHVGTAKRFEEFELVLPSEH